MSERTSRRRAINDDDPPDATAARVAELTSNPDPVQTAINAMAAVGDAIPSGTQADPTVLASTIARADATADTDPIFREQYDRATTRGIGFLRRVRSSGGRSALVPPACTQHPKLPDHPWGFYYNGKWMLIRWVPHGQPMVRQKRYEQGYTYFEGPLWARRLGLSPDNYLNERGRIQVADAELAWISEEYVVEYRGLVLTKQGEMVSKARDTLMGATGEAMPNVHVLEGSEEDVVGRLDEMKRRAAAS